MGINFKEVYARRKKSNRINEYYLINLIMFVGICFVGIGIEQFFIIKTIIPYMILLIFIGGSVACAVVFSQLLIQLNSVEIPKLISLILSIISTKYFPLQIICTIIYLIQPRRIMRINDH